MPGFLCFISMTGKKMMLRANSAGDFHYLLHHVVQQLGLLGVCGPVIYLFALPAGDDKATGAEGAEVMGYGRAGHIHNGGNVLDTFLAVAENPKYTQPGRISQLLEGFGYCAEILDILYIGTEKVKGLLVFVMIMWQLVVHRFSLPIFISYI